MSHPLGKMRPKEANMKVQRHFLEYQDDRSDKFYLVYITERGVLFNYGRHGTDGQEKWVTAPNFEHAKVHANKKIYEKLDKGYEQPYDPLVFDAPDHCASAAQFARAMQDAQSSGSIADAADDLASKAEEFAGDVANIIASVKRGMITPSEILTSIHEMESNLERTEEAIANAKLGLEMARMSLGRAMAQ